jgi:hypothetical protein
MRCGIVNHSRDSPALVGEGGSNERSEFETGEGSVSADGDPSSGADFVRATFSHKRRREESNDPARDD